MKTLINYNQSGCILFSQLYHAFFKLVIFSLIVIIFYPIKVNAQEKNPHRGLTVIHFIGFTPASINNGSAEVSLPFTVLGTDREDSLLAYARDNHITHLELYDLHKVFRYDGDPGSLLPNGMHPVDALCNFINKARNNYCIDEIGAGGEEETFFDSVYTFDSARVAANVIYLDSAQQVFFSGNRELVNLLTQVHYPSDTMYLLSTELKDFFRMIQFNGNCSAHIDFFEPVEEWWRINTYFSDYQPLLHHLDSLKLYYNSTHSDSIRIATYTKLPLAGDTAVQYALHDLYGNMGSHPIADRINAVHYGSTPQHQYDDNTWLNQLELFKDSVTRNKTDYHPYFSTETYFTNYYTVFLGEYLRDYYHTNIFLAEAIFFRDWISDASTHTSWDNENDIELGGCHYFASEWMVDSLRYPRTFISNSPICAGGNLGDSARFYYNGPREDSIQYSFILKNNVGSTVYSQSGYNPVQDSTLDSLQIAPLFVDTLYSPYIATLLLTYSTGCSYSFSDTVFISSGLQIQAFGPREFCEGQRVILKSSASNGNWKMVGDTNSIGTGDELWVDSIGTYYYEVSGGGSCSGISNQIAIDVFPNPNFAIEINCISTDSVELYLNPIPDSSSVCIWNTNDTAFSIIDDILDPHGYQFFAQVTTNDGCVRRNTKSLALPAHFPDPHITLNSGQQAYCLMDGDTVTLNPNDSRYGSTYTYSWDGNDTTTSGIFSFFPTATTTVVLTQTSATGCSSIGHDTITIYVYNCCNNPDSTAFIADSATNYPSGFIDGDINVRSDFYVDTNFTIRRTILDIDSSAHIYVLSGKTLTIDSSSVLRACNQTWPGIYLAAGASVSIKNSLIENADTAVHSISGAQFSLSDNDFEGNTVSVYAYNGSYSSSSVFGNTFNDSTVSFFDENINSTHIYLDRVSDITIGDSSRNQNFFSRAYYGIYAHNTKLNVFHCTFDSIGNSFKDDYAVWHHEGNAIYCENNNANPTYLTIGGTGNNSNTIQGCPYGIIVNDNYTGNIDGNLLNGCDNGIVLGTINPTDTMEIQNNRILNFYGGIGSTHSARMYLNIHDNHFNMQESPDTMPLSYGSPVYGYKGISIQYLYEDSTHVVCTRNYISNVKYGIHLRDADYFTVDSNYIYITLPQDSITDDDHIQKGLWVENSVEMEISNNYIAHTDSVSPHSIDVYLRGIDLSNCEESLVKENEVGYMGSGIWFYDQCRGTELHCNTIREASTGVNFYLASLSDQGTAHDTAWDNQWIDNANYKVDGTGDPIRWYQQGVDTSTNDFSPNPYDVSIVITVPNSDDDPSCSPPQEPKDKEMEEKFAAIVMDTAGYNVDSVSEGYKGKTYFYNTVSRDASLNDSTLTSAAMYQDAYDSISTSNVPLFMSALSDLQKGNCSSALSSVNAITTANTVEANLADVLSIYLQHRLDSLPYSTSDSLTLESIATQSSLTGGDGVFYARAILNLDIEDHFPALRKRGNELPANTQAAWKVYPNPVNGTLHIEVPEGTGEIRIHFTDILNRMLMNKEVTHPATIESLDITSLPQGMYQLTIEHSKSILFRKNIVIMR